MLTIMLAIGANRMIVRHIIAPIFHQTREQRLLFDGSVRRILIIFEIIFVVFFGSILIMVRSLAFHNRSERNQRVHRGFDGCETGRTPLMPLITTDRNQRRSHNQRHARTNIGSGGLQVHGRSRDRLVFQFGQLDQREQTLHERLILQRPGHAGIAHGNAVSAQPLAECAHGGIVVRDHGHVVPYTGTLQMLSFDLPHHVVELFGRGTVQGRFHTAVGRRDTSARIVGRQRFDGHRAWHIAHFAGTIGQRHVRRLRACDRQAHSRRDKRAIVAMHALLVRHGLRGIAFVRRLQTFDAFKPRSHARLRLVEQIFRI